MSGFSMYLSWWNIWKFFGVSVSRNIRKFCFQKYKKCFLLRKYKKFLNIRARNFHFPKYKEFFNLGARKFHSLKYKKFFRGGFFLGFFELGLKSALGSFIYYTSIHIKVHMQSFVDYHHLKKYFNNWKITLSYCFICKINIRDFFIWKCPW